MKKTICAAVLAGSAAIFATSFAAAPAQAAIGISFDFGNVALAYTDGYYDHHHHWHHWRHGEWDHYRRHHSYYHWRHDDHHHHHHHGYYHHHH